MNRRDFLQIVGAGGVSMAMGGLFPGPNALAEKNTCFDGLDKIGDKFRFAIFSDPQVGHLGATGRVSVNARKYQIEAINEINDMSPMPCFSLFLGDLVNVPDWLSYRNFMECIEDAKMPCMLVHGNHDGRPPYENYKRVQQIVSGHQKTYYSFDVGKWHFVVIPCNLDKGNPIETQTETDMLKWLKEDLQKNADRPTMFFEHLHMLPQGLTQLEWYTFRLELRKKIRDIITSYGNVRYYFNGHIHNGIKASVKMSWEYEGIKFVTVPTIIEGRNFGEEFEKYKHGLPRGGYYMIVEVDGEDARLKARLTGVKEAYVYPDRFKKFTDEVEPRWWHKTVAFEPNAEISNGGFEDGLNSWNATYRYQADSEPAFVFKATDEVAKSGKKSAFVLTRSKGRVFWAMDDMTGLYQTVKVPQEGSPVLNASYYLSERPENGGGFIRFNAVSGEEFEFLMMFHWGENQDRANFLPRSVGYEIYGEQQSWGFLQELGEKKHRGMYWLVADDPGSWHNLKVNLRQLYDDCQESPGAYDKLGITKLFLEVGTWSNRAHGSVSRAHFDDISLTTEQKPAQSVLDDKPLAVNKWVFRTRFGQGLIDWVKQTSRNQSKQPKD